MPMIVMLTPHLFDSARHAAALERALGGRRWSCPTESIVHKVRAEEAESPIDMRRTQAAVARATELKKTVGSKEAHALRHTAIAKEGRTSRHTRSSSLKGRLSQRRPSASDLVEASVTRGKGSMASVVASTREMWSEVIRPSLGWGSQLLHMTKGEKAEQTKLAICARHNSCTGMMDSKGHLQVMRRDDHSEKHMTDGPSKASSRRIIAIYSTDKEFRWYERHMPERLKELGLLDLMYAKWPEDVHLQHAAAAGVAQKIMSTESEAPTGGATPSVSKRRASVVLKPLQTQTSPAPAASSQAASVRPAALCPSALQTQGTLAPAATLGAQQPLPRRPQPQPPQRSLPGASNHVHSTPSTARDRWRLATTITRAACGLSGGARQRAGDQSEVSEVFFQGLAATRLATWGRSSLKRVGSVVFSGGVPSGQTRTQLHPQPPGPPRTVAV